MPAAFDEYLPIYVLTAVFGAIFIVGPLLVPKSENRELIQHCIMMTAFCMWIIWVTMYIAQMHPLQSPRIKNKTLAWLVRDNIEDSNITETTPSETTAETLATETTSQETEGEGGGRRQAFSTPLTTMTTPLQTTTKPPLQTTTESQRETETTTESLQAIYGY